MPLQLSPKLCPICKINNQFKFIRDYISEDQIFSLYECFACGVQFWMPFKNPGDKWYRSQKKERRENPHLYRGYHKKFLKLYKNILQGKTVLDVGCGRGELLSELQKKGCDCWGIDFNESVINVAKNYFGLEKVFVSDLNYFFDDKKINFPKFDIITSFEVMEHLDDPSCFIKGIAKLLKPGGSLIISVPSRKRLLVDSYVWDFPPSHLSRWDEKSIKIFFKRNDFKTVFINYTDVFFHLSELFFEKTQFGLMKKMNIKTSDQVSDNEKKNITSFNDTYFKKGLKTLIVKLLISFKKNILVSVPSVFIFFLSKILGIKNGVMVVGLKRD